jgi:hypothetical protein
MPLVVLKVLFIIFYISRLEIKENVNYDLNGWLQTERYFDVKATKAFEFDSFLWKTLGRIMSIYLLRKQF